MDRQELIDRLNGNHSEYTKKSATKQKKVQHEGQLQIACVRWFRLQYPAYASLLFHPKNEADGATSGKKIAINAAAGVVPGVPDLILAQEWQKRIFKQGYRSIPWLGHRTEVWQDKQSDSSSETFPGLLAVCWL